jgi:GAF domain-containing protein
MAEIDAILGELLAATGASRVTLRQDVPGDVFPVTNEAVADGAAPIKGVATPNMARQPVVLQVQQGRQVVQDDCLAASDEPHFREMLELYGGMRAQIVTPIVRNRRVVAIVSLHQLGRTRRWTEDEIAAASETARKVGELL